MPELYVITGSNGAGKSSIGSKYLPDQIRRQGPVFDGDKLFVEKQMLFCLLKIDACKKDRSWIKDHLLRL